jgi:hypothetical protein
MAVSLKQCTAYFASFGGLMAGPVMFSLPLRIRARNNAFREEMRYEASNVFSRR